MVIINPSQFKNAFLKALSVKEPDLIACWSGYKKQFTAKMRVILSDMAAHLKSQIYNEDYYTLDAIFYEEKDVEHFAESNTYAKYIAVALEHENRLYGTQVEMNKLQLFSAPLKVLITYSDNEKEKEKYLLMYASIIKEADVLGDISKTKKQLVVFGSCNGIKTQWSFHVYEDGTFITL